MLEDNFLKIHKALLEKFGFVKALIIQMIVDNGGEMFVSKVQLREQIKVLSYSRVSSALDELESDGVIKCTKIVTYKRRYILNNYDLYKQFTTKEEVIEREEMPISDKLPEKAKIHAQRIRELRAKKFAEMK